MPATLPDNALIAAGLRTRKTAFSPSSGTSSSVWFQEAEPDEVAKAKESFNFWLQGIAKNEALFEQYVYKNPDLTELDLHQHRARLFGMLAYGEGLVVTFWTLAAAKKIDSSNYFKLIQENLDNLLSVFNAWHGPLEAQEDIPEDFKEGIRDIAQGKIVDLDEALAKTPGADAV